MIPRRYYVLFRRRSCDDPYRLEYRIVRVWARKHWAAPSAARKKFQDLNSWVMIDYHLKAEELIFE
jgi:hypothetical protein